MLIITNVILDVTKNCNFKCKHCLKGEAIDEDLNVDILPKIFNPNILISNLELSGGEVFLNKEGFKKIVDTIIENNAKITHVDIVTNGTLFDREIEEYLKKLDNYIKKSSAFLAQNYFTKTIGLELSADIYHDDEMYRIKDEDVNLYRSYLENQRKLLRSKFFECYRKNEKILDMGRARKLDLEKFEPYYPKLCVYETNTIMGTVIQASDIRISTDGYVRGTKNGGLLKNNLEDIIRNNGIKCLNDEEYDFQVNNEHQKVLMPYYSILPVIKD